MKSKAAVAFEAGKPLSIVEIDVEEPKEHEVLVKIDFTSVCHTDVYTLSGNDPSGKFPCILGHEATGTVVQVGESVSSVKVGDKVVPLWKPECGECDYCKKGLNFCSAISETQGQGLMPDGTSRFSYNGEIIYHFMGTSTFSEYTVLADISVAKIPEGAEEDKVALLGCGVTTGLGAVKNDAQFEEGSTAAVFGVGTLGLASIQMLKTLNASRIIAIDIFDEKQTIAEEFGATDFINSQKIDQPIQDYIIEMTNGGVDYSFVCVGDTDTMNAGLECTHKGWGLSVIMGVASGQEKIATRPFQLITGRTWKGSSFGGVTGKTGLPELIKEHMAGKIDLDPFITHRMTIDEINTAIDLQTQGKSLRDIITFA
ncbi:S-(hydroxymethyl)glutathione dehydrogenase/class III alcohol dehydrogenase [Facklamia sp. DSM 111018]|uniref:S-(hydroxymethyl)glutathione dehydrogenase n=1 Tax=Facklamia lactis TaxID=2749967 RepID=A0ABS0LN09_9LACT|nr:S-(hydroxymethyl)glutathione dehydrogenase/class III alcohol dehydrogenase [Facklamia lactis]MBG9979886.1 S-(hydroxymethyl)glutathione dehydrogenase/class III alcohol dehydrogenase [Facklamia lactis]MBG9985434.1 S-(hydroxymethyl)glutathione dehydrogenase/class III alcohol dehydrogenase [Facklamia lactis]